MGEVVQFPQTEADELAELAAMPLSRLYQLRRMALDQSDYEWAALIDKAVLQLYER